MAMSTSITSTGLLAAVEVYLRHEREAEAAFAAWNHKHPDRDLPAQRERQIVKRGVQLAAVVRDTPAGTFDEVKAKARVAQTRECFGGDDGSVLHALLRDLAIAAGEGS